MKLKHHDRHKKGHGHAPNLLLVFLRTEAEVASVHFSYYKGRVAQFLLHVKEGHMSNAQLLSNATKGLVLTLVETLSSDPTKTFPLVGPFAVDVQDPANTITVVPGSADQKTPTIFRPNGSGNTGTVTVNVTDQSNGLKGSVSFDVVAPAPPPGPDTLTAGVMPEP